MLAQESRGTISGTVTDAQGAAIPKAKIVATEKRTGVKTNAVSEDTGAYNIPFLALGEYELTAEAEGFKKFIRSGITLSTGEHPVIDIRMEVGALTEQVTISAEAPILVTANPSLGQVITTAEVDDVPVNGRTPMMLDKLALGVVDLFEPGPVRPFDNGAPNQMSIGGAPSGHNEVLLNGSPNAGLSNNMAYSPMQDAVSEVRVNVFDMDASSGHAMGGAVNLITKGGTNELHGSAYIFNQTSVVDANSFFNNAKNVSRPLYHQNQYGGTAGGPVYLPKVFNGKNKVFWFFGYEGMRDSDPAASPLETGNPENYATVPTQAERSGDFSALLNLKTNAATIYDPSSGVLSGTQVSRTPFPNNTIPSSLINPIAKNYLQYFPLPNSGGLVDGRQNYVLSTIDSDGYDNELGRMDVNFSDKNRLSFDARHNYRAQNKNQFFDNPATGNFLYRINQGATLDDTYTLTPTTVADIRASWTRYQEHHFAPADAVDPTSLGFPSYIGGNAEFKTMPYISFNSTSVSAGARATFEPLGYNGDGTNYADVMQLFGQVVKLHGNHSLKTGVDVRQNRLSAFSFGNPSGTYGFKGDWVNSPAVSNTTVFGQDFAQFLLGIPSSGSLDLNTQSTVQGKYLALFVNDDWRVKSNLTLTLGVRFDHDFPEFERWNRTVTGFDPSAVSPISASAAAAYAANPNSLLPASQFKAVGGLTFPTPGNSAVYNTNSKIFSPRVGFAWTPPVWSKKTVIRGGFGVFVDPMYPLPNPNQFGFSQQTTIPLPSPLLPPVLSTLSNPFPNGFLQPAGSSKGAATYLGQNISFVDPNLRNPYGMRWELSIQRQLPGQMVFEVAYVGSHNLHEFINTNIDYIPRQYLSTSLIRDTTFYNTMTGNVPNPFKGLIPSVSSFNGSTIALQQLLAVYPQFPLNNITLQDNPAGSAYFQSVNVRLQKRYGNGLVLLNNFMYNRMEDRLAYLNPTDPAPAKMISDISRPLRNVMTATYQLPIGRGRKINLRSRLTDSLVGGWQLSGVYTLQSGKPLSWGNYIYFGGPLHYNSRIPAGQDFTTATMFDTTQFDIVSNQQPVDNIQYFQIRYNNLRRDATDQIDVSLDKNFHLGNETRRLQVRFEAYNLTNHVTFDVAATSPTATGFGTIGAQANTPRRIETALRLIW
jgi:hypothetical protein